MRFFVVFLSFGFFLLCLQTTVLNHIPGLPIKPDIPLIMVCYLGIFQGPLISLFLAFFFGYILDTLSGSVLGLYSFLRIVTLLLTQLASERLYLKNFLSQATIITILSIIDGFLLLFIMYIFVSIDSLWPFVLKYLPLQSIITGIIGPFFFFVLNKTSIYFEIH